MIPLVTSNVKEIKSRTDIPIQGGSLTERQGYIIIEIAIMIQAREDSYKRIL